MGTSLKLTLVMLIGVALSGCGTTCNLAGGILHPESEPRVYGGVIRDMEIIDKVVSGPPPEKPVFSNWPTDGRGAVVIVAAFVAIAALDPALSLAADTLTLPITVPLQARRIARQQETNSPNPAKVPTAAN